MIRQLTPEDYLLFRDIRLTSLQTDPKSFLSSFDVEKKYSPEYYSDRIRYSTRSPIYGIYGLFVQDPTTHRSLQRHLKTNQTYSPSTPSPLIGYIQLSKEDLPKLSHTANIYELYLRPEYRHQGYGRKLLNHLIGLSQTIPQLEQLHLRVCSGNIHAIKLYKLMGFEHQSTRSHAVKEPDGTYQDELLFMFPLHTPDQN